MANTRKRKADAIGDTARPRAQLRPSKAKKPNDQPQNRKPTRRSNRKVDHGADGDGAKGVAKKEKIQTGRDNNNHDIVMIDGDEEQPVAGGSSNDNGHHGPGADVVAAENEVGNPKPQADIIYEKFQTIHDLKIPAATFRGLCGYLHFILSKGYALADKDLDQFIIRYPEYEAVRPHLERQQNAIGESTTRSYHQWLLDAYFHQGEVSFAVENSGGSVTASTETGTLPGNLITRQALSNFEKEYPYHFLLAKESLIAIARQTRRVARDVDLRAQLNATPTSRQLKKDNTKSKK